MYEEDEAYFVMKAPRSILGMKNENVIFEAPIGGEYYFSKSFKTVLLSAFVKHYEFLTNILLRAYFCEQNLSLVLCAKAFMQRFYENNLSLNTFN